MVAPEWGVQRFSTRTVPESKVLPIAPMGSPPSAAHTTPWLRPRQSRGLWPEARWSEGAAPPSRPCRTGTAAPELKHSDDRPHAPWFASATQGLSVYPQPQPSGIPADPFSRSPYDSDVLCRSSKHGGDLIGDVSHPLRLVPQGQAIAVPRRDRGVQLDRIVVLARDRVGLVDLDLGGCERSFWIATPCLGWPALALIGLLLRRQHRLDARNVGTPGFRRVGDAHQRGRIVRLFECFGDHESDRLALMAHPVVLQYVQALTHVRVYRGFVLAISKSRHIAMGHDRHHAGRAFRRRALDGGDAAVRDRAPHDG